jgi:hypothetical protein
VHAILALPQNCSRKPGGNVPGYRAIGDRNLADFLIDATLQISLFTKLKLAICARAGDRAGLSAEHRRSIEILPVTLAEQERLLQPCGRRMALTPSRRRSPVSRLYFQELQRSGAMHFCLIDRGSIKR